MIKQELVPIYTLSRTGGNTVCPHATGTLMRYGSRHFVATASHAFHHSDIAALMLPGPSGSLLLNRPATIVNRGGHTHKTDPIDFGIIDISQDEAACLRNDFDFLDVMAWQPMDHPGRSAYCHLAGFPCDANLPHDLDELQAPQLFRIDAETDKNLLVHSDIPRHKEHPEDYIAFRYDPRKAKPRPGSTTQRPKTLEGMSGGAIYAGHSPINVHLPLMQYASKHYIGMFLQVASERKKRRTGEILCIGLSLLAIQRILTHWFDKE